MAGFHHFSKTQIATAIAISFHAVGLAGIVFFKNSMIIHLSAFNLLLCFALLIWTQEEKNISYWLFTAVVIISGFSAEVIGVHTGWLFGEYHYGNALGLRWQQVPLVIGINWFIIIYCCGISVEMLLRKIMSSSNKATAELSAKLKAASIVVDGATLAVLFDWLMEPVAVKLGFWKWNTGDIPSDNYISWFLISVLLLILFQWCRFNRQNKFAVHLFLIQCMFFLLLRTFYQPN